MAPGAGNQQKGNWKWVDLRNGAVLQTVEALSLGLPFEVWKTRMGRFRTESNLEAIRNVHKRGGLAAFWAGALPKGIESASKGAVLLFAKDGFDNMFTKMGLSPTVSALLAGAAGGTTQTIVMGPCTFLVTGAVTGDKSVSLMSRIRQVYQAKGIAGFYAGGVAVGVRQATNWASREGFTVGVRQQFRKYFHDNNPTARLSAGEEILAAAIGGTLSCWNHPFEVVRIEMQSVGNIVADKNHASSSSSSSTSASTSSSLSTSSASSPSSSIASQQPHKTIGFFATFGHIYRERGLPGFFRGVVPRILLGVYQTLFMVTIARVIKERGWLQ